MDRISCYHVTVFLVWAFLQTSSCTGNSWVRICQCCQWKHIITFMGRCRASVPGKKNDMDWFSIYIFLCGGYNYSFRQTSKKRVISYFKCAAAGEFLRCHPCRAAGCDGEYFAFIQYLSFQQILFKHLLDRRVEIHSCWVDNSCLVDLIFKIEDLVKLYCWGCWNYKGININEIKVFIYFSSLS